jgi:hypothetical protein
MRSPDPIPLLLVLMLVLDPFSQLLWVLCGSKGHGLVCNNVLVALLNLKIIAGGRGWRQHMCSVLAVR